MRALRRFAVSLGLIAGLAAAAEAQSITRDVEGTQIRLPVPKGLCELDTRQPADKTIFESVAKGAEARYRVLALLLPCPALAIARRDGPDALKEAELLLFGAPPVADASLLQRPRAEAVRAVCAGAIEQSRAGAYRGASYRERLAAIERAARVKGAEIHTFLFVSERACYQGGVSVVDDSGTNLHGVNASTLVRNKAILVSHISIAGKPRPLDQLVEQTKGRVIELATLNGEP